MKAFFFGCLLIFLDFHLELNSVRIGLLPNFVGYYLLLRGMRELKEYSPHFSAPRGVVAALMVYSAILWGLDLLGLGEEYLAGGTTGSFTDAGSVGNARLTVQLLSDRFRYFGDGNGLSG